MRLWHQKLIPLLPRQQLLGQHREVCALRGLGWKKSHSVVNYVFSYNYGVLFKFHEIVMNEMQKRGYNVDPNWTDPYFRGYKCERADKAFFGVENAKTQSDMLYQEHNEEYLKDCIENMRNKRVNVSEMESLIKQ